MSPARSRSPPAPGVRARPEGERRGRVRIIAGRFRRTPIPVVDAPGLRPTPDRVRETLFNWLEHLLGGWAGVRALDLFAGSGALGWECASRGACEVVLVEHHRAALRALHALQERLPCPAVQVLARDWTAAIRPLAPGRFDLVFLDPPFGSGLLARAIPEARRVLRPGGLLYVESDRALVESDATAQGLAIVRHGHAGGVFFHLLRAPAC